MSKTIKKLIPLVEMSGDHFEQIFIAGFAPKLVKEKIQSFNSLYGFHLCIANFGHFESYELAKKLGYDVQFKNEKDSHE